MRILNCVFMMICSLVLLSFIGCETHTNMNGTLEVTASGELRLKNYKQKDVLTELRSGSYDVDIRSYMNDENLTISLTSGADGYYFKFPKLDLSIPKNEFLSSQSLGQPIDISIENKIKFLRRYETANNSSCTFTGYCYTCLRGMDGDSKCGYKYSSLCAGTITTLDLIEESYQTLTLKFLHQESVLGVLNLLPNLQKKLVESRVLRACG